jgi:hypothetical protein
MGSLSKLESPQIPIRGDDAQNILVVPVPTSYERRVRVNLDPKLQLDKEVRKGGRVQTTRQPTRHPISPPPQCGSVSTFEHTARQSIGIVNTASRHGREVSVLGTERGGTLMSWRAGSNGGHAESNNRDGFRFRLTRRTACEQQSCHLPNGRRF